MDFHCHEINLRFLHWMAILSLLSAESDGEVPRCYQHSQFGGLSQIWMKRVLISDFFVFVDQLQY